MRPDRLNYEIWFTDWLDGKLSESQSEQLQLFLKDNPDLKEELHSLAFLKLKPGDAAFPGKDRIRKSVQDYSDSQIEYLSIAYLENDLSAEKISDLKEVTGNDNEKRKLFELIQRLRLTPPEYGFTRKASIKKSTPAQKAVRFSVIGLSAAAAIALLVTGYLFLPERNGRKNSRIAMETKHDYLIIGASSPAMAGITVQPHSVGKKVISTLKANSVNAVTGKEEFLADLEKETSRESIIRLHNLNAIRSLDISCTPVLNLAGFTADDVLAPYNPEIVPPLYDPAFRRSNVDRFLARFFHEKIMKDRKAGDRPVNAKELAKAGINGLDKLLGLEMVLEENKGTTGAEKTYHFNPRFIRIQTPVKKISDIL